MEVLTHKRKLFNDSCNTLNRMIAMRPKLHHADHNEADVRDLFTAGVIHHFELTYETYWKYLKQYLYDKHGIDVASPKSVFQSCFKVKILTEDLANQLIRLADIRNQTTHTYDRAMAQIVCEQIITYHHVLDQILQVIKE